MKKYPRVEAILQGIGVYLVFLFLPVGLLLAAALFSQKLGDGVLEFLSLFSSLPAALLLLLLWRIGGQKIEESAGWRFGNAPLKSHGLAFVWGFLGNWVVVSCLTLLPESVTADYVEQSGSIVQESYILTFLSTVLAAPICEEILFRGMIFRSFRRAVPAYWAAVLSGLLFGAAHGQLLWIVYASILGFFLALLTDRAGTITISIAAHMGFNFVPFLTMFLPEEVPLLESRGFYLVVGPLAGIGAALIWWKFFLPKRWRNKKISGEGINNQSVENFFH